MAKTLDDLIDNFIFEENIWSVMFFEDGYNEKIMSRLFEQSFAMLKRYSRVLFLRFDIHICGYAEKNKAISKLMRLVSTSLKKQYECDIGYLWIREQDKAEKQHYHGVLMLNGHKVRHPSKIHRIIETFCKEMSVFTYSIPSNSFYMMERNNEKSIQAALYRGSYLAKNYSKGNRPKQTKDYQATRLKSIT